MSHSPARAGFTLIELAIVLAIIGLITGGVLGGREMIRASELRAVTTEYQRYKTAIGAFKEQYRALPGDMLNATSFWGAQHGTPANCQTTASSSPATCDGNGDGFVSNYFLDTQPYEAFRAWQHLANAGLMEGRFSGVGGAGGTRQAVIGTNVPGSKLPTAGWSILGMGNYNLATIMAGVHAANFFTMNYGTTLVFGSASGILETRGQTVLSAEEAFSIDSKMDDGNPNNGNVLTFRNAAAPNCINAGNNAYNLAAVGRGCGLFFITGF